MATKPSEDPMDLGGFMQNFVLSNPFRDSPGMSMGAGGPANPPYDPLALSPPLSPKGNSDESHSPISCHSNLNGLHDHHSNGLMEDGMKSELLITDRVGKVMDTPKGHIGSNRWFATALKKQQVADWRVDVQSWLRANYCYVPEYTGVREAKSLLAAVSAEFPEVTAVILSKVMTFTFPDCPKVNVNNVSRCQGYRGLVSKPQPEDYCNLDLLKAVNRVKKTGLLSSAADMFSVPEAAVAGLYYWHGDRGGTPSEDGDRADISKAQNHFAGRKRRRCKRRRLPKDYLDPDSLSDMDDDRQPPRRKRNSSLGGRKHSSNVQVKEEVDCDKYETSEVAAGDKSNRGGKVVSMLKKLLKGKQTIEGPEESPNNGNSPEQLDSPLVIVKSEPVDPDYGDANPNEASRKVPNSQNNEEYQTSPLNMTTSQKQLDSCDVTDVDSMRAEISRLQSRLGNEESHSAHLNVELASTKKEVSSLKSTIRKQEMSMIELAQDFSMLHEQFRKVTNKFMLTLSQLSPEQQPKGDVEQSNPSPTAQVSNRSNKGRRNSGRKWKFHASKLFNSGETVDDPDQG